MPDRWHPENVSKTGKNSWLNENNRTPLKMHRIDEEKEWAKAWAWDRDVIWNKIRKMNPTLSAKLSLAWFLQRNRKQRWWTCLKLVENQGSKSRVNIEDQKETVNKNFVFASNVCAHLWMEGQKDGKIVGHCSKILPNGQMLQQHLITSNTCLSNLICEHARNKTCSIFSLLLHHAFLPTNMKKTEKTALVFDCLGVENEMMWATFCLLSLPVYMLLHMETH